MGEGLEASGSLESPTRMEPEVRLQNQPRETQQAESNNCIERIWMLSRGQPSTREGSRDGHVPIGVGEIWRAGAEWVGRGKGPEVGRLERRRVKKAQSVLQKSEEERVSKERREQQNHPLSGEQ